MLPARNAGRDHHVSEALDDAPDTIRTVDLPCDEDLPPTQPRPRRPAGRPVPPPVLPFVPRPRKMAPASLTLRSAVLARPLPAAAAAAPGLAAMPAPTMRVPRASERVALPGEAYVSLVVALLLVVLAIAGGPRITHAVGDASASLTAR